MEKQVKRIIRYIENHIKEYTINFQIDLTDQNLEDHKEQLKRVVQITNLLGVQKKAAWVYKLIEKIQNIRLKIHQAKRGFINGKK